MEVKHRLRRIMSSLWDAEFEGSAEQQNWDRQKAIGKQVWHDQDYRLRLVTVYMLGVHEITQEQRRSPSINLGKMHWGFSLLTFESQRYAYAKAMAPPGVFSQ